MEKITIDVIQKHMAEARKYRERRHGQWTQNYLLYRDTVQVNELTQRQSVNLPLMKKSVRTLLSNSTNPPDLAFEDLGNDDQKELYLNEYWADRHSKLKMRLLHLVDMKQVFLYGRSFMKHNIRDGKYHLEVIDPQDILISRYTDPWDIETSPYIIHTGIFRRLSDLERNPLYDKEAILNLKKFYATQQGLIKAAETTEIMTDREERMRELGVPDVSRPILGETYVEVIECQIKVWNSDKKTLETRVYPIVNSEILIPNGRPMTEILGINEFSFTSWADDLERTDIWSDGVGDILRVPNQVLNVWISQLTENRTLRNFGMQFYDQSANQEWAPPIVEPTPFGWFPVPGDPNKVLKRVEVPDLSEMLDEMKFVMDMGQGASGATAIKTGEGLDGKRTLGEIEELVGEANRRINATTPLEVQNWKEIGDKFAKIANASARDLSPVKLYKKGPSGQNYPKVLRPVEFQSSEGYECKVVSKAEKEADTLKQIQKMKLALEAFPGNQPLQKIYKDRLLDLISLPANEKKEVQDFDLQTPAALPAPVAQPAPQLPINA